MDRLAIRSRSTLIALLLVSLLIGCQSQENQAKKSQAFFEDEKLVVPGDDWVCSVNSSDAKEVRFLIVSEKKDFRVMVKRLRSDIETNLDWKKHVVSWTVNFGNTNKKTINVPSSPIYFIIGRHLSDSREYEEKDDYRLTIFDKNNEQLFSDEKTILPKDHWTYKVDLKEAATIRYRVESSQKPVEVLVLDRQGFENVEKFGFQEFAKHAGGTEHAITWYSPGGFELERTISTPPKGPIEFTIATDVESLIRLKCYKK